MDRKLGGISESQQIIAVHIHSSSWMEKSFLKTLTYIIKPLRVSESYSDEIC